MRKIITGSIVSATIAFASQSGTFEKILGGKENDVAKSVVATDDGYLIAGKTNSFTKYRNFDAYLVKLDKQGNEVWSKHFGGKGDEEINRIVPYGKDFLLLGSTQTYGNERLSYYLNRIDPQGETVWSHAFYTNADDEFHGTLLAVEGEDIVFGGTQRHLKFFSAEVEPQLFRVNKELERQWKGYFGGKDEDYANALIKTDGGYIMVGTSESFSDKEFDGYVVKIGQNGKELWYNFFGGEDDDIAYDIAEAQDGYLIVGSTDSFDLDYKDVYVVKIDREGNILWQKSYGGDKDDVGFAITAAPDGGYVITGYTESFDRKSRQQLYLLKIDDNGNKLWSRTYGGESDDAGYDVITTDDGGYLVVGDKQSDRSRDSNFWVLKVDAKGQL